MWEREGKEDVGSLLSQDSLMTWDLQKVEAYFGKLQSESINKDIEDKMVCD